jgi:micrococcal nuclease
VPQWVIWVILIIIAIAIIWFFWNRSQESKAAAERTEAERRRAASATAARTAVPAAPVESRAGRVESRLQDAADTAMGTDLPEETARIDAAAANLAQARREAEAAADRLSDQAGAALEEVRRAGDQLDNPGEPIDVETVLIEERRNVANLAAQDLRADDGEVPLGAVRGDGGRDCPPVYPIKANAQSMLYHTTASHSYNHTTPAFCFTTTSAAEAAGYSPARD